MSETVLALSKWDTTWIAVGAIAQAIVALGLILGLFNLRRASKLRILSFEDRFEERYQQLMERLSLEGLRGATLETPPAQVSEKDQLVVRAYFRLCESQLNVRAAGWVSDGTWAHWKQGMTDRMGHWPFTAVWDEIRTDLRAGHLYRRLRAFKNDNYTDPCTMKLPRRWWRGLTGPNRR
ncbi:hypothetical protein [Streptomyces sp. NPDC088707]|uniref:hypothetical protein n=1 Tax=Streptomyces sp. NPDC088707 TaxID=3365871 RepID=UPI0037F3D4C4